MSYPDPINEILDRVRRIETRVTITGKHVGADVGGGKPIWRDGKITTPSGNTSLNELLKVIPPDWDKGFHVYVGDSYLFSGTVIPQ